LITHCQKAIWLVGFLFLGNRIMTKVDSKIASPHGEALENNDAVSSAELQAALARCDPNAIRELIKGLRTIRYGSILLTLHEGQLVEISKTVRIRPLSPAERK
jgi:hypothetical protein